MFAVLIFISLSLKRVESANHYRDHWKDQIGPMDGDISMNIADIKFQYFITLTKIAMRIDIGAN